jgi:hypothetical protein
MKMRLSRRALLQGAGALPLAAGGFGFSAFAQAPSAAPTTGEIPPILFAHGNGDHGAVDRDIMADGIERDCARADVCD